MDKRIGKIVVAAVLVMILLAGGSFFYKLNKRSNGSSGIMPPRSTPTTAGQVTEQTVTKTGTIICLGHRSKGVQTQECAMGLQADDGKSYGLSADDPTVTGSLPYGQRVEVTGTLTSKSDTVYDSVGVIQVVSARTL